MPARLCSACRALSRNITRAYDCVTHIHILFGHRSKNMFPELSTISRHPFTYLYKSPKTQPASMRKHWAMTHWKCLLKACRSSSMMPGHGPGILLSQTWPRPYIRKRSALWRSIYSRRSLAAHGIAAGGTTSFYDLQLRLARLLFLIVFGGSESI